MIKVYMSVDLFYLGQWLSLHFYCITCLSLIEDEPMKLISIVAPCFNEAENVRELYDRIKNVMMHLSKYKYELIFIDNASKDNTLSI